MRTLCECGTATCIGILLTVFHMLPFQEQKLLIRVSAITDMDIIRVDRDGHIFLICRMPIGEEG